MSDIEREATEEMLNEGVEALIRGLKNFPSNYTQVVSNIWEDMEAARTQAPASGEVEPVDPDIQLIQERDYWEEKATELAEDVGKFLGIEMGEHSSDNCPVQNAIDVLFNTHPPAKVPEPDQFWDADNSETNYSDPYELADNAAQDLRKGETMTVDVLCGKELPKRTMKIWVTDGDEVEFEWLPTGLKRPNPPQQKGE